MKQAFARFYTVAIFLLSGMLSLSAFPSSPQPPRLVNDFAGIIGSRKVEALERVLTAFDDSTSNQIAVVTVKDLEGRSSIGYATEIGLAWKVGSEKFNNGIVILVKPKTAWEYGDVAIAVGYGLEGAIPDAYSKRIIENIMIPLLRDEDYAGAVEAACEELMALASGEISEPRDDDGEDWVIIALIVVFLIILLIATALLEKYGNGGNHRGGGSGTRGGGRIPTIIITGNDQGHDWGGFGGSSGGGFGGFGGGSFGGGGASGRF